MSQQSKVRRNGSPSTTKQGPIKAVKAFSLKQGKSSSKSTLSPSPRENNKAWSHRSPEHRLSPEASCPTHVPKGKWRANSADTVVPSYLTGQWPKDINSYHHYQSEGVFMCDKATQTVDEWTCHVEKKKKGHRRSASFGQGDQLKLQYFKQHLQKSKEGSKQDSKQRSSPIQGNHSALSMTAPPALGSQIKTILVSAGHIPRQNMNRYQRNSVEGLNTEIEKLVSSVRTVSISSGDGDETDSIFKLDIPDGHRAPVPELSSRPSSTRSIDTQTPSSLNQSPAGLSVLVPSLARPTSISPETAPRCSSVRLVVSRSGTDSTDSKSSKDMSPELCESSPNPTKSCPFVREPPDGCEKVTVVDESKQPQIKEPMLFSPVKPNHFVFKQSQGSAFCSLAKSYFGGNQSPGLSAGIES